MSKQNGESSDQGDDQEDSLDVATSEYPEWKTNSAKKQLNQIFAGALSAAITRFASQPLDVIKVRFQLQLEPLGNRAGQKSKYRNVYQAMRTIYKEEGMFSLWRGHNPAQVLSILYGISQFWIYESLRLFGKQAYFFKDHANLTTFLCGAVAGTTATFITMPVDVVRTRLIAQDFNKGYSNATSAIGIILKTEGVRGCYRGLISSVIQIGPLMGTNFMFYRAFSRAAENYLEVSNRGQLPTWTLLAMGATSGLISKTLVYPLDLIKKRLQIQGFQQNRTSFGANMNCVGMVECLKFTLHKEGVGGLYKGIVPTLIKSGVMTGLHFGFYDKIFSILQTMS